MNLLQKFMSQVREQNLFQASDQLLLAVSGGLDSVVLCELCVQSGYSISIAHANFQLRAQESEADEQFVRRLAEGYKIPVHIRLFETKIYAADNQLSIQVAARELRYSWFRELLAAGPQWLLTGHHSNDNTETILMNFFRGTGISGLRGILPKKDQLIRPLLSFTKEELLEFAVKNNLQWREDSSNSSEKYSRNYFRNSIIPLVNKLFPEAENNLKENSFRFREIELLYHQSVALHKKKLLEYKGNEIHIPVLKLKKTLPLHTIVYEIIKEFQFSSSQVKDVIQLLDSVHGKYISSATHRIIRNRKWLIIAAENVPDPTYIIIEEGQTEVAGGLLKIETTEKLMITADLLIARIDCRLIHYPLIFRKWKPGDYFYPLGMSKKKKISRFLIDQKLSPTQKERSWVLESNKKICWIAGMRIDDRFKISENTKTVLQIAFDPQLLK